MPNGSIDQGDFQRNPHDVVYQVNADTHVITFVRLNQTVTVNTYGAGVIAGIQADFEDSLIETFTWTDQTL